MENKDLQWFATVALSEYKGEYAIILDQKVVLHGKDLKKLIKEFRTLHPNKTPKIAKIPEEHLLVLFL